MTMITFTLSAGWWIAPALFSAVCFVCAWRYARTIPVGGNNDFGVGAMLWLMAYVILWVLPSLVAWLIWALMR